MVAAAASPPTSSSEKDVLRLRPESAVRQVLPTFLADIIEVVVSFILVHYLLWFGAVFSILYSIHWSGYTYVSIAAVVLYVPVFFNKAHVKLTPAEGGMQWDGFRTHALWTLLCSYMKLDILREAPLDPSKQYIFGCHPHGILILSRLATFGGNFEQLFPGIQARALGATPMFYIPMAREICMWVAAVDASPTTAVRVLQQGMSVIVYPGGSKEIFLTDPNSTETALVLGDRMGFVKLAIQYGADLVPMFAFGEKWMYNIWNPPTSVRQFFLKTLKVPLLLFWGRFGTWLPVRLTGNRRFGVVYGKPIPVHKNAHPTPDEVAALHAIYIERVQEIFAKYKAEFGYDDNETLTIVSSKRPQKSPLAPPVVTKTE
ncbi:Aste57867_9151 [Aphanomyces stellatus]|uniref:Acyltransferase n=1 Tax=Aphanomyces stellatus TaxID=120398 RepID=A0A485KM81_9STRA|nr:hypothetical protein As57867_009115 [Aphanomyces stellatus]VFT86035.1 Aste57867_9151 [Aphanomyces stellatus]